MPYEDDTAADHLEAIDAHLRDDDAKHSPVIVTILSALRNLLAPDRERFRDTEPQDEKSDV